MKDLIDFPCSPDFLDYYHRLGLTPRNSGRQPGLEALEREVSRLREDYALLRKEMTDIKQTLEILLGENYRLRRKIEIAHVPQTPEKPQKTYSTKEKQKEPKRGAKAWQDTP